MSLITSQLILEEKWLWQNEFDDEVIDVYEAPDKTYLVFGIYFLDAYPLSDVDQRIRLVNDLLSSLLKPWMLNYPWSELNNININTKVSSHTKEKFILGQICVEDNVVEEERLIVCLLYQLSLKLNINEFIKIADTHGDVLLVESYKQLPKDYQFPVSINRLWLHEGKFKFIPDSYQPGKGLTPNESITFLENSYFKCIEIEAITKNLKENILDLFPNNFLSNLTEINLEITDPQLYDILRSDKSACNYIIKSLKESPIVNGENVVAKNKPIKIKCLISKDVADLLSMYMDANNLKQNTKNIPRVCGNILQKLLKQMIEERVVEFSTCTKPPIDTELNSPFGNFQFESVTLNSPYSFPKEFESDSKFTELFTDYLHNVTQDMSSFSIDENDNIKMKTKSSNKSEKIDKKASDSTDNDDSDESNESHEIEVNEDEFFEFFLKNALQLKDEEILSYMNDTSNNIIQKTSSQPKENQSEISSQHDSNINDWEATDEQLDHMLANNSSDNIKALLKSMSVDGTPNEMLEFFLNSLSNDS